MLMYGRRVVGVFGSLLVRRLCVFAAYKDITAVERATRIHLFDIIGMSINGFISAKRARTPPIRFRRRSIFVCALVFAVRKVHAIQNEHARTTKPKKNERTHTGRREAIKMAILRLWLYDRTRVYCRLKCRLAAISGINGRVKSHSVQGECLSAGRRGHRAPLIGCINLRSLSAAANNK